MKLEEQQLDKCQLNDFITLNSEKLKEGLDTVIADLKRKAKLMRKNANGGEGDEEVLKEAVLLCDTFKFLKKNTLEKLARKALLDKKSLRKKLITANTSQEQRAVCLFATHKDVKPIIMEFREQYPNWKDAKDLVTEETEKKETDQILTEVTNVKETEGKVKNGKKGKGKVTNKKKAGGKEGKLKKKNGKKSLKRKNVEADNDSNNNMNQNPKKKKRKLDSSGHTSSPEDSSANEGSDELPTPVIKNGINKESSSSPTKEKEGGFGRRNPWQKGRGGKFNGRGNFQQNKWNRNGNFRGRNGSWRGKQQGGWQQRNFCDKNSPNSIPVTSDWQNKTPSKDSAEGQTTSLLRPSWLTNPEERKPTFNNFRGKKNFGKREPANSNRIRVSPEWKNKPETPNKTEEGQAMSLLRPDWLTSPQERKPASASLNKSRGNSKKWRKC